MANSNGRVALGAAACALGLSLSGPGIAAAAPTDNVTSDSASSNGASSNSASSNTAGTNGAARDGSSPVNAAPSATGSRSSRGSAQKRTPAPAASNPRPDTAATSVAPHRRVATVTAPRFASIDDAVAPTPVAVPTPRTVSPGADIAAAAAAVPAVMSTVNPIAAVATLLPQIYRSAAAPVPAAATASVSAAVPVANASAAGGGLGSGLVNPLGDFVGGALLKLRRAFSNKAPTAAPVQAMVRPSGQVWGFIAGKDPDGDQISYTLKNAPKYGTVAIDKYGVYTYTPNGSFSGTDSFTAVVSDSASHSGFGARKTVVKVTVNANAADPAGTVVDNFNGSAGSLPNSSLWGYHLGPYRDDGLQTYTNSTDNVRLDGQGHLLIQAQNTPDGYTSTRLVTQDKLSMQYGVIQARIKMPSGQGIWPSFWTLGTNYYPDNWTVWPSCGEIDIMELVNTGTNYYVTLHGPQGSTDYYGGANGTGQVFGNSGSIYDLTTDYHDYWTMWREDQVVIGVDDTMLGDFTPDQLPPGADWAFNRPMYAVMQIAVGGTWAGPPDSTTPWPATMTVDSFSYTPLP